MSPRTATEAAAILAAARAYRNGRAAGYLDLAGSRADLALHRRELDLLIELGYQGIGRADVEAAVPCMSELTTALAAEVRPRLRREAAGHRGPGVRNAIRRAARALELELDDVAPGLDPELERVRARSRSGRMAVA